MQLYTINLNKAFLVSILWTISSFMTIPQSSVQAGSLYIFDCQQNSETGTFTTVVKKRPSGKAKELIRWQSKYVPRPIRKTCGEISGRFQDFWDKGNLNWLVISRSDRASGVIVCGFAEKNSSNVCDERHKIFALSPLSGATSPNLAYKALMRNLTSASTETSIYQGSDDDIIIDFKASIEQQSTNR